MRTFGSLLAAVFWSWVLVDAIFGILDLLRTKDAMWLVRRAPSCIVRVLIALGAGTVTSVLVGAAGLAVFMVFGRI